MNRKFIGRAKVETLALELGVWHDLVFEMRGRTIAAFIDGKQVLEYRTNAGDAPQETVQFAVGNDRGHDVMTGWHDDVRFEPLDATPAP
ncbi:hypothetical protein EBR56_07045 [bacterium]|nr:hypothetical protein [bacterium]